MIPLRLDVTNFLSYQQTVELSFDGIDLACITGQNGAGKSSLLEAITWALFGRARSASDDDVVNRVAAVRGERAEVRFTFALGEAVYRVVRKRKRNGRGGLEFQLQNGRGDGWTALSETKMRETQAKIEQTLRMSYDTFVNVSFFLQGQADAFTTQTAGQRKEILADLLGVNEWNLYKAEATVQRKEAENQLRLTEALLGENEGELLEQPAREQALAVAEAEAEAIEAKVVAQEALHRALQKAADDVAQQKALVSALSREQQVIAERTATIETNLSERVAQKQTYEGILARQDEITAAYHAWEQIQTELEGWQQKQNGLNQIQQAMRPHELAVERTLIRLTQQKMALDEDKKRVDGMADEKVVLEKSKADSAQKRVTLEAQLATLADVEHDLERARETLNALVSEQQLSEQKIVQLTRESAEITRLIDEKPAVEARVTAAVGEIAALDIQIDRLEKQRIELTQLKTEVGTLTTSEQPRLKDQMNEVTAEMDAFRAKKGKPCPTCRRELTDDHLAIVLGDLQKKGKTYGDAYRANQKRLATMTARIAELDRVVRETANLARKLRNQQQILARDEARLSEMERQMAAWVTRDGEAELAQLQARVGDGSAREQAEIRVNQLKTQAVERQQIVAQLATIETELATYETRLTTIDAALERWARDGSAAQTMITKQLADDQFEEEARAELVRLQRESADIAYDAAVHESLVQKRDGMRDVTETYQQLGAAVAAVDPLSGAIADLEGQVAEQAKRATQIEKQVIEAQVKLEALTAEEGDLSQVEDEMYALRDQRIEAVRKVGAAQQRLAVLDNLREADAAYRIKLVAIRERIQRLKSLEMACGRDGIQALLIEQALPSIEESANDLLDRLSDGQMRVAFLTQEQKKSKKNELRETLKIQITDASGERPYENFSGGEQFRINFAIRLALSKILAKRAGARLQTLVIDEGFGSQDSRGRQRLIEAINVIKPDFERILVITHIDELKEAFPTRIEIQKTPSGSQVSLIQ